MKPVLGRDPFARPTPEASPTEPKPEKKAKGRKISRPPEIHSPKDRSRSGPTEMQTQPVRRKSKTSPPPSISPEPVERKELLDSADGDQKIVPKILDSTRFVRPSYYGEKLGKLGMRFHSEEVDPFGYDAVYWDKVEPFFQFLFEKYWRVELIGLEHIPGSGRVLLVGNHSGTLPYDGAMIKYAVENQHPSARPVRFLVEDFVFHFPFLGTFMNRIGGVRACQDNARRLLENEHLVVVFPEGIKGIGKLFKDRYQLQRFGRGGFIKLALRTQSPIVPVALIGAEEIHPMLAKLTWLARPLGLPYLPITPTFPFLGPLGAAPLPSKWIIQFGKPFTFEGYSPEDAEDPLKVMELAEQVRSTIQESVTGLLQKRDRVFW